MTDPRTSQLDLAKKTLRPQPEATLRLLAFEGFASILKHPQSMRRVAYYIRHIFTASFLDLIVSQSHLVLAINTLSLNLS